MRRLILAALAALLTALVPAADAVPKKPARAEIVCFKKTIKTKSGRMVRKKVCRPRRNATAKPKTPTTTAPATPAIPKTGEGPGPSTEVGSPIVVAPAAPTPVAPVCVPEDSPWLAVTALDVSARFTLRLSRTCLRAGRTIVQYDNQDAQEHDLWVEGTAPRVAQREVVASAAPESLAQAETTLSAGEWRLFCSIPGHGTMSRTVTVVP